MKFKTPAPNAGRKETARRSAIRSGTICGH